jgi:tetratricopeptide (TPR) repeat protein
LADALTVLLSAHDGQDRIGEAQAIAERAFDIRQKLLPADDPLLAQSMEWLGRVAAARREFEKAEASYKAALAIVDSDNYRNGPRIAAIAANLGALYV